VSARRRLRRIGPLAVHLPGLTRPLGAHGESTYRPDIDGLRAIAVLSVLVYHLKAPFIPGGFVGVDIFFVISGFLITRNIWTELEGGTFTISGFYLRRIRRIAPAFVVMAAVTLLAGCLLLLPEDLRRLGSSTGAAALSASNVYFAFALDTGYFADTSDQEPMLHTWSLGVEEQFYLLWPAALLALTVVLARLHGRAAAERQPARWTARRWAILGALALLVASFAAGELMLDRAPQLAYFLLPARAGELMAGALLAFVLRRDADVRELRGWLGAGRTRLVAEMAGLTGLALIGWSLTQLSDESPFPGLNALPPALGSMLVIMAGGLGSSVVGRLLGWGPMVFIGLISYSLYLWHWPVLAYTRYFYGSLDAAQVALLVPVIFALAIASYLLVELPARTWRPRPRVQVARLFAAPTIGILLGSGVILASDGLSALIAGSPEFEARLASLTSDVLPALDFDYNCQQNRLEPEILTAPRCLVGDPATIASGEPNVLLWGDSHAAAAIGFVGAIAQANGSAFRNASFSGCPPLFGGEWGAGEQRIGCTSFRRRVEKAVMDGRYRVVILGGIWSAYDRDPRFEAALEDTARAITGAGARVVFLGQVPRFLAYQRQCPARALRWPVDCAAISTIPDEETATDRFIEGLPAMIPNTRYLSVRDRICHDGSCSPYLDGAPLYFNVGHLSIEGSWRLGREIAASPAGSTWISAIWGP
jgi:peptidoglycan/LPS O-acetylase OafA/YrhL